VSINSLVIVNSSCLRRVKFVLDERSQRWEAPAKRFASRWWWWW